MLQYAGHSANERSDAVSSRKKKSALDVANSGCAASGRDASVRVYRPVVCDVHHVPLTLSALCLVSRHKYVQSDVCRVLQPEPYTVLCDRLFVRTCRDVTQAPSPSERMKQGVEGTPRGTRSVM